MISNALALQSWFNTKRFGTVLIQTTATLRETTTPQFEREH
jgi:hypothetical protein